MADFGGRAPPVNPSMNICPPFGPGAGPASACNCIASSSGSSKSAAIWRVRSTRRAAVRFGFGGDSAALVFDGDHLFSGLNGELDIEYGRTIDREVIGTRLRKALRGDADLVLAGGQGRKCVPAFLVGATRRSPWPRSWTIAPGTAAPEDPSRFR